MGKALRTFDVYWSPEGRRIATVQAADERSACRKAPQPYRRYLGELYAQDKRFCPECDGQTYVGIFGQNERRCPTCDGTGMVAINA